MVFPTEYAHKRKRKTIVAFILLASQFMIVVFVIISFLGSSVGRYTVSLEPNRAALTLAIDNSFTDQTTLLRATSLDSARAESVDFLPDHDVLDNATGQGSHNGNIFDLDGNILYSNYFAYTFYIKNLGNTSIDYQVNMALLQDKNIIDGAMPIEDYVRIRLYQNMESTSEVTHNYRSFAKTTNYIIFDTDNNRINGECIGNALKTPPYTCSASKPENSARAEEFVTSSEITTYDYLQFLPGEVIRYTIVIWLEGDDPDCTFLPPTGASMEFGMNISALIT